MEANKLGFIYEKEKPEVLTALAIRDHNGTPINNRWGFSRVTYEYDNAGHVITTKALNKNGELDGNAPKSSLYDISDTNTLTLLTSNIKQGLFTSGPEIRYTYDDKHRGPVKIGFFGIDGLPTTLESGLRGVAAFNITYDENDNITSLKLIGTNGLSISPDTDRKSEPDEIKMEYDNKANIIKISFFKNGEPIPRSYRYQREDETAVASISFQFDEQRHVTEVRYFDKNGAPTYRTTRRGNLQYYGVKFNFVDNKYVPTYYLDSQGNEL